MLTMPSYTLDEHGVFVPEPATVADLIAWADIFQHHFGVNALDVKIGIDNDLRSAAALFPGDPVHIFINVAILPFHDLCKISLLHEMIHLHLWIENGDADVKHGARFKGWVKRLMDRGVYEGLL
jgi:hypothetical protein